MVTTRFTKLLHQQVTKHNITRGGFTNFIQRWARVWQWSPPVAPVVSWGRASGQKEFSAFCHLINKGEPSVVWVLLPMR